MCDSSSLMGVYTVSTNRSTSFICLFFFLCLFDLSCFRCYSSILFHIWLKWSVLHWINHKSSFWTVFAWSFNHDIHLIIRYFARKYWYTQRVRSEGFIYPSYRGSTLLGVVLNLNIFLCTLESIGITLSSSASSTFSLSDVVKLLSNSDN